MHSFFKWESMVFLLFNILHTPRVSSITEAHILQLRQITKQNANGVYCQLLLFILFIFYPLNTDWHIHFCKSRSHLLKFIAIRKIIVASNNIVELGCRYSFCRCLFCFFFQRLFYIYWSKSFNFIDWILTKTCIMSVSEIPSYSLVYRVL